MHRTETLDYSICLKGECDLELDDGRKVPMKAGDICVQRGTMHAWVAKGSEPAVFRVRPDRRRACREGRERS
jgi:quercetin dioxygenase-like cupin family protein